MVGRLWLLCWQPNFPSLWRENVCKRCKGLLVKGVHFKFGLEPAFMRRQVQLVCAAYSVRWRKGRNISCLQDHEAHGDLLSKLVLMKAGLLHIVASRHMSVIKVSFSGLEGWFTFLLYILQQNYWLFQKSPFITC